MKILACFITPVTHTAKPWYSDNVGNAGECLPTKKNAALYIPTESLYWPNEFYKLNDPNLITTIVNPEDYRIFNN